MAQVELTKKVEKAELHVTKLKEETKTLLQQRLQLTEPKFLFRDTQRADVGLRKLQLHSDSIRGAIADISKAMTLQLKSFSRDELAPTLAPALKLMEPPKLREPKLGPELRPPTVLEAKPAVIAPGGVEIKKPGEAKAPPAAPVAMEPHELAQKLIEAKAPGELVEAVKKSEKLEGPRKSQVVELGLIYLHNRDVLERPQNKEAREELIRIATILPKVTKERYDSEIKPGAGISRGQFVEQYIPMMKQNLAAIRENIRQAVSERKAALNNINNLLSLAINTESGKAGSKPLMETLKALQEQVLQTRKQLDNPATVRSVTDDQFLRLRSASDYFEGAYARISRLPDASRPEASAMLANALDSYIKDPLSEKTKFLQFLLQDYLLSGEQQQKSVLELSNKIREGKITLEEAKKQYVTWIVKNGDQLAAEITDKNFATGLRKVLQPLRDKPEKAPIEAFILARQALVIAGTAVNTIQKEKDKGVRAASMNIATRALEASSLGFTEVATVQFDLAKRYLSNPAERGDIVQLSENARYSMQLTRMQQLLTPGKDKPVLSLSQAAEKVAAAGQDPRVLVEAYRRERKGVLDDIRSGARLQLFDEHKVPEEKREGFGKKLDQIHEEVGRLEQSGQLPADIQQRERKIGEVIRRLAPENTELITELYKKEYDLATAGMGLAASRGTRNIALYFSSGDTLKALPKISRVGLPSEIIERPKTFFTDLRASIVRGDYMATDVSRRVDLLRTVLFGDRIEEVPDIGTKLQMLKRNSQQRKDFVAASIAALNIATNLGGKLQPALTLIQGAEILRTIPDSGDRAVVLGLINAKQQGKISQRDFQERMGIISAKSAALAKLKSVGKLSASERKQAEVNISGYFDLALHAHMQGQRTTAQTIARLAISYSEALKLRSDKATEPAARKMIEFVHTQLGDLSRVDAIARQGRRFTDIGRETGSMFDRPPRPAWKVDVATLPGALTKLVLGGPQPEAEVAALNARLRSDTQEISIAIRKADTTRRLDLLEKAPEPVFSRERKRLEGQAVSEERDAARLRAMAEKATGAEKVKYQKQEEEHRKKAERARKQMDAVDIKWFNGSVATLRQASTQVYQRIDDLERASLRLEAAGDMRGARRAAQEAASLQQDLAIALAGIESLDISVRRIRTPLRESGRMEMRTGVDIMLNVLTGKNVDESGKQLKGELTDQRAGELRKKAMEDVSAGIDLKNKQMAMQNESNRRAARYTRAIKHLEVETGEAESSKLEKQIAKEKKQLESDLKAGPIPDLAERQGRIDQLSIKAIEARQRESAWVQGKKVVARNREVEKEAGTREDGTTVYATKWAMNRDKILENMKRARTKALSFDFAGATRNEAIANDATSTGRAALQVWSTENDLRMERRRNFHADANDRVDISGFPVLYYDPNVRLSDNRRTLARIFSVEERVLRGDTRATREIDGIMDSHNSDVDRERLWITVGGNRLALHEKEMEKKRFENTQTLEDLKKTGMGEGIATTTVERGKKRRDREGSVAVIQDMEKVIIGYEKAANAALEALRTYKDHRTFLRAQTDSRNDERLRFALEHHLAQTDEGIKIFNEANRATGSDRSGAALYHYLQSRHAEILFTAIEEKTADGTLKFTPGSEAWMATLEGRAAASAADSRRQKNEKMWAAVEHVLSQGEAAFAAHDTLRFESDKWRRTGAASDLVRLASGGATYYSMANALAKYLDAPREKQERVLAGLEGLELEPVRVAYGTAEALTAGESTGRRTVNFPSYFHEITRETTLSEAAVTLGGTTAMDFSKVGRSYIFSERGERKYDTWSAEEKAYFKRYEATVETGNAIFYARSPDELSAARATASQLRSDTEMHRREMMGVRGYRSSGIARAADWAWGRAAVAFGYEVQYGLIGLEPLLGTRTKGRKLVEYGKKEIAGLKAREEVTSEKMFTAIGGQYERYTALVRDLNSGKKTVGEVYRSIGLLEKETGKAGTIGTYARWGAMQKSTLGGVDFVTDTLIGLAMGPMGVAYWGAQAIGGFAERCSQARGYSYIGTSAEETGFWRAMGMSEESATTAVKGTALLGLVLAVTPIAMEGGLLGRLGGRIAGTAMIAGGAAMGMEGVAGMVDWERFRKENPGAGLWEGLSSGKIHLREDVTGVGFWVGGVGNVAMGPAQIMGTKYLGKALMLREMAARASDAPSAAYQLRPSIGKSILGWAVLGEHSLGLDVVEEKAAGQKFRSLRPEAQDAVIRWENRQAETGLRPSGPERLQMMEGYSSSREALAKKFGEKAVEGFSPHNAEDPITKLYLEATRKTEAKQKLTREEGAALDFANHPLTGEINFKRETDRIVRASAAERPAAEDRVAVEDVKRRADDIINNRPGDIPSLEVEARARELAKQEGRAEPNLQDHENATRQIAIGMAAEETARITSVSRMLDLQMRQNPEGSLAKLADQTVRTRTAKFVEGGMARPEAEAFARAEVLHALALTQIFSHVVPEQALILDAFAHAQRRSTPLDHEQSTKLAVNALLIREWMSGKSAVPPEQLSFFSGLMKKVSRGEDVATVILGGAEVLRRYDSIKGRLELNNYYNGIQHEVRTPEAVERYPGPAMGRAIELIVAAEKIRFENTDLAKIFPNDPEMQKSAVALSNDPLFVKVTEVPAYRIGDHDIRSDIRMIQLDAALRIFNGTPEAVATKASKGRSIEELHQIAENLRKSAESPRADKEKLNSIADRVDAEIVRRRNAAEQVVGSVNDLVSRKDSQFSVELAGRYLSKEQREMAMEHATRLSKAYDNKEAAAQMHPSDREFLAGLRNLGLEPSKVAERIAKYAGSTASESALADAVSRAIQAKPEMAPQQMFDALRLSEALHEYREVGLATKEDVKAIARRHGLSESEVEKFEGMINLSHDEAAAKLIEISGLRLKQAEAEKPVAAEKPLTREQWREGFDAETRRIMDAPLEEMTDLVEKRRQTAEEHRNKAKEIIADAKSNERRGTISKDNYNSEIERAKRMEADAALYDSTANEVERAAKAKMAEQARVETPEAMEARIGSKEGRPDLEAVIRGLPEDAQRVARVLDSLFTPGKKMTPEEVARWKNLYPEIEKISQARPDERLILINEYALTISYERKAAVLEGELKAANLSPEASEMARLLHRARNGMSLEAKDSVRISLGQMDAIASMMKKGMTETQAILRYARLTEATVEVMRQDLSSTVIQAAEGGTLMFLKRMNTLADKVKEVTGKDFKVQGNENMLLWELILANFKLIDEARISLAGNYELSGPAFRTLNTKLEQGRASVEVPKGYEKHADLIQSPTLGVIVIDKSLTWFLNHILPEAVAGTFGLMIFFDAANRTAEQFGIRGLVKQGADDAVVFLSKKDIETIKNNPKYSKELAGASDKQVTDWVAAKIVENARAITQEYGMKPRSVGAEAVAKLSALTDVLKVVEGKFVLESAENKGKTFTDIGDAISSIESGEIRTKIKKLLGDRAQAVLDTMDKYVENLGTTLNEAVSGRKEPFKRAERLSYVREKAAFQTEEGQSVRIDGVVSIRTELDQPNQAAARACAEAKGKGITAVEQNQIGPSVFNLMGSTVTDRMMGLFQLSLEKAIEQSGFKGKVTVYEVGPLMYGLKIEGVALSEKAMTAFYQKANDIFMKDYAPKVGVEKVYAYTGKTPAEVTRNLAAVLSGTSLTPEHMASASVLLGKLHTPESAMRLADQLRLKGADEATINAVLKFSENAKYARGIEDIRRGLKDNGASSAGMDMILAMHGLPYREHAEARGSVLGTEPRTLVALAEGRTDWWVVKPHEQVWAGELKEYQPFKDAKTMEGKLQAADAFLREKGKAPRLEEPLVRIVPEKELPKIAPGLRVEGMGGQQAGTIGPRRGIKEELAAAPMPDRIVPIPEADILAGKVPPNTGGVEPSSYVKLMGEWPKGEMRHLQPVEPGKEIPGASKVTISGKEYYVIMAPGENTVPFTRNGDVLERSQPAPKVEVPGAKLITPEEIMSASKVVQKVENEFDRATNDFIKAQNELNQTKDPARIPAAQEKLDAASRAKKIVQDNLSKAQEDFASLEKTANAQRLRTAGGGERELRGPQKIAEEARINEANAAVVKAYEELERAPPGAKEEAKNNYEKAMQKRASMEEGRPSWEIERQLLGDERFRVKLEADVSEASKALEDANAALGRSKGNIYDLEAKRKEMQANFDHLNGILEQLPAREARPGQISAGGEEARQRAIKTGRFEAEQEKEGPKVPPPGAPKVEVAGEAVTAGEFKLKPPTLEGAAPEGRKVVVEGQAPLKEEFQLRPPTPPTPEAVVTGGPKVVVEMPGAAPRLTPENSIDIQNRLLHRLSVKTEPDLAILRVSGAFREYSEIAQTRTPTADEISAIAKKYGMSELNVERFRNMAKLHPAEAVRNLVEMAMFDMVATLGKEARPELSYNEAKKAGIIGNEVSPERYQKLLQFARDQIKTMSPGALATEAEGYFKAVNQGRTKATSLEGYMIEQARMKAAKGEPTPLWAAGEAISEARVARAAPEVAMKEEPKVVVAPEVVQKPAGVPPGIEVTTSTSESLRRDAAELRVRAGAVDPAARDAKGTIADLERRANVIEKAAERMEAAARIALAQMPAEAAQRLAPRAKAPYEPTTITPESLRGDAAELRSRAGRVDPAARDAKATITDLERRATVIERAAERMEAAARMAIAQMPAEAAQRPAASPPEVKVKAPGTPEAMREEAAALRKRAAEIKPTTEGDKKAIADLISRGEAREKIADYRQEAESLRRRAAGIEPTTEAAKKAIADLERRAKTNERKAEQKVVEIEVNERLGPHLPKAEHWTEEGKLLYDRFANNLPKAKPGSPQAEANRLLLERVQEAIDASGGNSKILYHNERHLNELFEFARSIGAFGDPTLIRIAITLHDVGYFLNEAGKGKIAQGHEDKSKAYVWDNRSREFKIKMPDGTEKKVKGLGLSDLEAQAVMHMIEFTKLGGMRKGEPTLLNGPEFAADINMLNRVYAELKVGLKPGQMSPEVRAYIEKNFSAAKLENPDHRQTIMDAIRGSKAMAAADIYGQAKTYIDLVTLLHSEFVFDQNPAAARSILQQIAESPGFHQFVTQARIDIAVKPGAIEVTMPDGTKKKVFVPGIEISENLQNMRKANIKEMQQVQAWVETLMKGYNEDAYIGLQKFISGRNADIVKPDIIKRMERELDVFAERGRRMNAIQDALGIEKGKSIFEAYTEAVGKGNTDLAAKIATEYKNRFGLDLNTDAKFQEVFNAYKKAVETGNADLAGKIAADYKARFGKELTADDKIQGVFDSYKKAIKDGNSEVAGNIAQAYKQQFGVELYTDKRFQGIIDSYQKAMGAGNIEFAIKIAEEYRTRFGRELNTDPKYPAGLEYVLARGPEAPGVFGHPGAAAAPGAEAAPIRRRAPERKELEVGGLGGQEIERHFFEAKISKDDNHTLYNARRLMGREVSELVQRAAAERPGEPVTIKGYYDAETGRIIEFGVRKGKVPKNFQKFEMKIDPHKGSISVRSQETAISNLNGLRVVPERWLGPQAQAEFRSALSRNEAKIESAIPEGPLRERAKDALGQIADSELRRISLLPEEMKLAETRRLASAMDYITELAIKKSEKAADFLDHIYKNVERPVEFAENSKRGIDVKSMDVAIEEVRTSKEDSETRQKIADRLKMDQLLDKTGRKPDLVDMIKAIPEAWFRQAGVSKAETLRLMEKAYSDMKGEAILEGIETKRRTIRVLSEVVLPHGLALVQGGKYLVEISHTLTIRGEKDIKGFVVTRTLGGKDAVRPNRAEYSPHNDEILIHASLHTEGHMGVKWSLRELVSHETMHSMDELSGFGKKVNNNEPIIETTAQIMEYVRSGKTPREIMSDIENLEKRLAGSAYEAGQKAAREAVTHELTPEGKVGAYDPKWATRDPGEIRKRLEGVIDRLYKQHTEFGFRDFYPGVSIGEISTPTRLVEVPTTAALDNAAKALGELNRVRAETPNDRSAIQNAEAAYDKAFASLARANHDVPIDKLEEQVRQEVAKPKPEVPAAERVAPVPVVAPAPVAAFDLVTKHNLTESGALATFARKVLLAKDSEITADFNRLPPAVQEQVRKLMENTAFATSARSSDSTFNRYVDRFGKAVIGEYAGEISRAMPKEKETRAESAARKAPAPVAAREGAEGNVYGHPGAPAEAPAPAAAFDLVGKHNLISPKDLANFAREVVLGKNANILADFNNLPPEVKEQVMKLTENSRFRAFAKASPGSFEKYLNDFGRDLIGKAANEINKINEVMPTRKEPTAPLREAPVGSRKAAEAASQRPGAEPEAAQRAPAPPPVRLDEIPRRNVDADLTSLRKTNPELAEIYRQAGISALKNDPRFGFDIFADPYRFFSMSAEMRMEALQLFALEARKAVYEKLGIDFYDLTPKQIFDLNLKAGHLAELPGLFDIITNGSIRERLSAFLNDPSIKNTDNRITIQRMDGATGAFRLRIDTPSGTKQVYLKETSVVPDEYAMRLLRRAGVMVPDISVQTFRSSSGSESRFGLMSDIESLPGVKSARSIAKLCDARNPALAASIGPRFAQIAESLGYAMEMARRLGLQDRHIGNVFLLEMNDGTMRIGFIDLDIVSCYPPAEQASSMYSSYVKNQIDGFAYLMGASPAFIGNHLKDNFLKGAERAAAEANAPEFRDFISRAMESHHGSTVGWGRNPENPIDTQTKYKINGSRQNVIRQGSEAGRFMLDAPSARQSFMTYGMIDARRFWEDVLQKVPTAQQPHVDY